MDLWKRSSQASYSDQEAAACARSRANLMRVIASLDEDDAFTFLQQLVSGREATWSRADYAVVIS